MEPFFAMSYLNMGANGTKPKPPKSPVLPPAVPPAAVPAAAASLPPRPR